MASLFRARRDDGEEEANPVNNKWLVGLVSGAGKLISSVFRSAEDDGEEEESGSDEEFEVDAVVGDEEKDGGAGESQRMLQESNQDKIDEPKVVSPSKAAIEQLLTHETFSREESEKLIKLIKSRITEPSSSPVLEFEAVSEAKKWIMEKKRNSNLFEPCAFNTDNITNFGIESDIIGSPIDVAKSYMLSKPPWKSPFLTYYNNSMVFKTPSRKISDDIMLTSSSAFSYSFPSSKGLKRDFFDSLEDSSRRIRSKLIQIDSNSKLFDTDTGGKQNEGETENQGLICENNGFENNTAIIVDPIIASEKEDEQIPLNNIEIDLNKTNSKNSSNGVAEKSNMESETLKTETLNVKKGRKRVASKVVSGRGGGRAKAAKLL